MPFENNAERDRLLATKHPPYEQAVREVNRWMVRQQLSAQALANRLGLGRSTLNHWLQGSYPRLHPENRNDVLTPRIWEHVAAHPAPAPQPPAGRLLETRNSAEIRRLFNAGLRQRAFAILYGAPSAEKTFLLKNLVAERLCAGHEDALLVEAIPRLSPLGLLQLIAGAAGVPFRSNQHIVLLQAIAEDFRARPRLPLVIVDEAQFLKRNLDTFDMLRRLRDLTANDLAADTRERPGCGILCAGSHELFQLFSLARYAHLVGQIAGRITHRVQLSGMNEEEVLAIAAKELGNGRPARLDEKQRAYLLEKSRDVDAFALDADGKPAPHEYFSPRKLAVAIDRLRDRLAERKRGAA